MIPPGTIFVLCYAILLSCLLFIGIAMQRKDKPTIATLFFVCVVGLGACVTMMYIIDNSAPDEYYLAYTLNDQYVGDITTATGEQYTNVLIFNVTPQQYAYGSHKLHAKTDIFGNLKIYDSKYLGETDHHHQLYFAGEHEGIKRLPMDTTIVCRWIEVAPGDYSIKGVWGTNEVEWY